ncbi:MAG: hypothetical protein ACR2IE_01305 [Candidatus Sumerlaeaceae bacterium]
MVGSSLKLTLAMAVLVAVATGCNGPQGPPVPPEHLFNRCPPGPKPCPRECPDFPLPPGGPYLTTPGIHAPLNPAIAPAEPVGGGELSVKQK